MSNPILGVVEPHMQTYACVRDAFRVAPLRMHAWVYVRHRRWTKAYEHYPSGPPSTAPASPDFLPAEQPAEVRRDELEGEPVVTAASCA